LIARDIFALRTFLELPYRFLRTFQIRIGKLPNLDRGIAADSSTKSMVKKSIECGDETEIDRKGR
jgi:hypothetical protein